MNINFPLFYTDDDDFIYLIKDNCEFLSLEEWMVEDYKAAWDHLGRPVRLYRKEDPNKKGHFDWLFGKKKINVAEYISDQYNLQELKDVILNSTNVGRSLSDDKIKSFGDNMVDLYNYIDDLQSDLWRLK